MSMKKIQATMALTVEVYDRAALMRAAFARAKRDGVARDDYADTRRGREVATDLQMLLDPGSVPGAGFEILDGSVELCR